MAKLRQLNQHFLNALYKGRFKNWQVCAESGEDIPFNQSGGGSSSSRHVSAD